MPATPRRSASRRKKLPSLLSLLAPFGVLSALAILFYVGYCSILWLPDVPGGNKAFSVEDDPGHSESTSDRAGLTNPMDMSMVAWIESKRLADFQAACERPPPALAASILQVSYGHVMSLRSSKLCLRSMIYDTYH